MALENGVFPSYVVLSETDEIEEERRIAYVAVTRAKNKLYLTSAKRRLLYGNVSRNKPSQFLLEYSGANKFETRKSYRFDDDEYGIKQVDFETPKPKEEVNNSDEKYKVGDFIIHKVYGEGIIVSLDDDTIGKICFTSKGEIKTFDLTHPSIRRK